MVEKLSFPNPTQSYLRLLDALQKRPRPVVAWVGAGLSQPAGLPGWIKLREGLENEIQETLEQVPQRREELKGRLSEIKKQQDPWKAFGMIENALKEATFRSSIRARLNSALKVPVPELYRRLWSMPVNGMINLNIDRLAQRALTEARPGKYFLERHGHDVTTLIGKITSDIFIANVHGVFEDPETWVFTDFQRTKLLTNERYHEFIRDCIKYCTIVLLGISADDVAVLDHFRRASIDGISLDTHYWLTDRDDIPDEVERYGISVIHYENSEGSHRALLKFAADGETISLSETLPPVIASETSSTTDLPTPQEIVALTPNQIRTVLNSAAARLLSQQGDDAYRGFDEFCKKYARAILNAGYVSNDPDDSADKILNYRITGSSESSEGAFGKVWRAVDDAGTEVALKIFRYEVREKPDLLKAFRRGIKSLRILSDRNLPGIVEFKSASEIPPVLVMEWIDGANLQEAVLSGQLRDWPQRLRIAHDLAQIIFSAHNVPERVLHRDIRPPNIMLRDFYSDPEASEIVVLDFDLSWHVGSLEQSVFAGAGSVYLAPEQLSIVRGASSRSAAVDSFGFGMTLYFLLTGQEPSSTFRNDWKDIVVNSVGRQQCKEWRSLPTRLARLITGCTTVDQHRRPIFSQIVYEIKTMHQAACETELTMDSSFLAEEILARAPEVGSYDAFEDGSFGKNSPSGLGIRLGPARAATSALSLKLSFQPKGTERFQNLTAIADLFRKILDNFEKSGFISRSSHKVFSNVNGNCILEVDVTIESQAEFEKFCKQFSETVSRLSTTINRS